MIKMKIEYRTKIMQLTKTLIQNDQFYTETVN